MDDTCDAPGSVELHPEPLEARRFEPYGEVIEATAGRPRLTINDGHADRYDDLARIVAEGGGARPVVSLFRTRPWVLPLRLALVERHVLGSQLFMPLGPQRYLVVVAAAGTEPGAATLRCFAAGPGQGVNLAPGTWHHPLLALEAGDFLVVDRGGAGLAPDCEVRHLAAAGIWIRSAPVPTGSQSS